MNKLNILVTGTSRGIGQSIVSALGAHNVVGHSTRDGDERRIAADLSQPGAAGRLWAEALERLGGRIDALVNNAGIFEAAPVEQDHESWVAAWERTMRINLTASAELCRLAVLHSASRAAAATLTWRAAPPIAATRRSTGIMPRPRPA